MIYGIKFADFGLQKPYIMTPLNRINNKINILLAGGKILFLSMILMLLTAGQGNCLYASKIGYNPSTDSVYNKVDKSPVFKGSPSNIQKFVKNNLIYPEDAWMKGIEGVVQVSFVITDEGKLMNVKIEKSINPELDIEAIRVVEMLDKWKPGVKNGKAVHSYLSIPVEFILSPDEREFIATLKKYGISENPPLYIIDDKIVNSMVIVPSYNVKSIRVLKGDAAINRFGEKGVNGVVIITTKRGTPPVR